MFLDTRILGGMDIDRENVKEEESNEFTHRRQTANDDGMYHCSALPFLKPSLGSDIESPSRLRRQFLHLVTPLRSNSTANAQIINREPLREADRPAQHVQQFHRHDCGVVVEDTPCRADGQTD